MTHYALKPIRQDDNPCVIIDGVRTPFAKSFGAYQDLPPLNLFARVVDGLLRKTEIDPEALSSVICGTVISHLANHNIARDAVLELGLPRHIDGQTINRACASSLQAVATAAEQVLVGNDGLMICGGVENLTDCPISYSKEARSFLVQFSRARNSTDKVNAIKNFSAKSFLPSAPDVVEGFTGLTMGQHTEIMAKKNSISRSAQDEFAVASHHKAAAAREKGYLAEEIVPVWLPGTKNGGTAYEQSLVEDDLIRADSRIESLQNLRPSFDKRFGSLTAANSSALTDGASACLVTSLERAKALGLTPKAKVVDYCTVAVDPEDQLLIGPALAIPLLLKRNGLKDTDIDTFEIHEAFAAQVLSCIQAMGNEEYINGKLSPRYDGASFDPVNVPLDKLNPNGGSLAIGHPFGATGTRIVTALANELSRTGKQRGVIAICAAGGMAQAMLIERV